MGPRKASSVRMSTSTCARSERRSVFDYQHDTGGDHNRKVHAVGTVLNLYF